MKLTRICTLLILPIVLTACQSSTVNKLIRDLPSPDGRFHVEVLQCRANDVMFGGATQVQISVLKKVKLKNVVHLFMLWRNSM